MSWPDDWHFTDEQPPKENGLYLVCELIPEGIMPFFYIGWWDSRRHMWYGIPETDLIPHGARFYWTTIKDPPEMEIP